MEIIESRKDAAAGLVAREILHRHGPPAVLSLEQGLTILLHLRMAGDRCCHKANDGVVYAIRAWFKYDTALSAVV